MCIYVHIYFYLHIYTYTFDIYVSIHSANNVITLFGLYCIDIYII